MAVAVVTGVVTMATQLLKMAISTVIGGILTVAAVVAVIVIVVVILSGCSLSESSEVGEAVGATNSPSPAVAVSTSTTEPLASPAPTAMTVSPATAAPQSNGGQPTPRAETASPTAVAVTPTTAPTTEPPDSSAPTATTVSPPRAETATARPERKTANPIATSTPPPTPEPTPEREYEIVSLLPPDAIPSISNPKFVSAEEAGDDYGPDELVLGVEIDGDARAYSIPLLSRHEIVNDVVGGKPIAVTW